LFVLFAMPVWRSLLLWPESGPPGGWAGCWAMAVPMAARRAALAAVTVNCLV
jgi:hypothetical protein